MTPRPSQLSEAVQLYVEAADPSKASDAAIAICGLLKSGQATVMGLGGCLTSVDPIQRNAGTKLLAEVAEGVPEVLSTPEQLHLLAEFLGARLADWECAESAARGCLALVKRAHHPAPATAGAAAGPAAAPPPRLVALSQDDGAALIATFASAQVRPLARPERQALLQLWLALLQTYGTEAAKRGTDLADVTLSAIDEEKDPRCLMLSFKIIKALADVYHSPGVPPGPLQSHAEEFVELLSCYFPIQFAPPKNDPHGITRDQLERALEAALACSPFLAQWGLPLVLDKLSSTHRPSKMDAMSALVACCRGYGREAMEGNMKRVWLGLRHELLAPAERGIGAGMGATGGAELADVRGIASAAAACLKSCLAALGPGTLDAHALGDTVLVGELRAALSASGSDSRVEGKPRDPTADRGVASAAAALAAAAGASPACCTAVSSKVLPWAFVALPPPAPQQQQQQERQQQGAGTDVGSGGSGGDLTLSDRHLYALLLLREQLREVAAAVAEAVGGSGGNISGSGNAGGWASCYLVQTLPEVVERTVQLGRRLVAEQGLEPEAGHVASEARLLCCWVLREAATLAGALLQQEAGGGQVSVVVGQEGEVGLRRAEGGAGQIAGPLRKDAAELLLQWTLDAEGVEEEEEDGRAWGQGAMGAGASTSGNGAGGGAGGGERGVPGRVVEMRTDWGRKATVQREAAEALLALLLLPPAPDAGDAGGGAESMTAVGEQPALLELVVQGVMSALAPSRAGLQGREGGAGDMDMKDCTAGSGQDDGFGGVTPESTTSATSSAAMRQALAVAAELARRGPPALGRRLARRWRPLVLEELGALARGRASGEEAKESDALLLCGLLSCLASVVLPAASRSEQHQQYESPHTGGQLQEEEQGASATFTSALMARLSAPGPAAAGPVIPDAVAWAAAACVRQLVLQCTDEQQSEAATSAADVVARRGQLWQSQRLQQEAAASPCPGSSLKPQAPSHRAAALPAACLALVALRPAATAALLRGTSSHTSSHLASAAAHRHQGVSAPPQQLLQALLLLSAPPPHATSTGAASLATPGLSGAASGSAPLELVASIALAALLNNAPASSPASITPPPPPPETSSSAGATAASTAPQGTEAAVDVDALVSLAFDGPHGLLQQAAQQAKAMRALSWACHALAMRGHPRASQPVEVALAVLTQQLPGQQQSGAQGQADAEELVAAAAALFAVLVSGRAAHSPAMGTAQGLDEAAAAASWVSRPLWQQRAFSTCLARVLSLEEGQGRAAASAPASAPAAAPASAPPVDHLLALCRLLGACPAPLLRSTLFPPSPAAAAGAQPAPTTASRVASALVRLLSTLPPHRCRFHSDALLAGMSVLQDMLSPSQPGAPTAAGTSTPPPPASVLEPEAGPLVGALCALSAAPGVPAVREGALRLLAAAIERLPYHALHPYRQQVLLKALPRALDDDKRQVRRAAISCKRAWEGGIK